MAKKTRIIFVLLAVCVFVIIGISAVPKVASSGVSTASSAVSPKPVFKEGSSKASSYSLQVPENYFVMNDHPPSDGLAEKIKFAKTYKNYIIGKASKGDVSAALKNFYKAAGDSKAAENMNINDVLPDKETINSHLCENRVPGLKQYPQETEYYCGDSTVQSILGAFNINVSQDELAQKDNLWTTERGGTYWYVSDDNKGNNKYVVANVLNKYTDSSWYVAEPHPSKEDIELAVFTDIMSGHGVAVLLYLDKLDDRPEEYPLGYNIRHWVAVNGYKNFGSTVEWADPSVNSCVNMGSRMTSAYITDSTENIEKYVAKAGIIW